jgi:glycosyltransferase involved in cell wall biosynthesis
MFRFNHGGVENGIVELLNSMPACRYRHAIVVLEGIDAGFSRRVRRHGVESFIIHERPGKVPVSCGRIRSQLRRLRPAIVHARIVGTLVVVGTVGRLDPTKNEAGLLRAFRAILDRHPAWQLLLRPIIAGDGQLRVELAALAREVGLRGSVGLPGALGGPNVSGAPCTRPLRAKWHRQH